MRLGQKIEDTPERKIKRRIRVLNGAIKRLHGGYSLFSIERMKKRIFELEEGLKEKNNV